MGSKNRIYLGAVTAMILHHLRNKFSKPIYMSKRVQSKIKVKHPDSFCYTDKPNFKILQKNTIAFVQYSKSSDTYNFISNIPKSNTFVLYALKSEKHHTSCTTVFRLRKSTLRKYYNDVGFVLMKSEFKVIIEEYIN